MPLYVKDPEVGELAEKLAALTQTTKTEAVRRALAAALARHTPEPEPGSDAEHLTPGARRILDQAAALREKYPSGGHGLPVTKEWIDSLYED
jgi:antitoxin VapB